MERTHPTPTPYRTPADRGPQECDGCRDIVDDLAAREAQARAADCRLNDRAHRRLDLRTTFNQADETLRHALTSRTAVA
ncbi:hypothetical protein OHR86_22480 [Streptomyces sp. NBC_00441]|uniref:hypothetical protein n=1 Tax=Streptomyces sp. NBC_00441 TaxID=2975742 RepID=UPI002E2DBF66|nr:hypothetical protein [Streptomyces sp. NBC_00441]